MRRLSQVTVEAQVANLCGLYSTVIEQLKEYLDPALRFNHVRFLTEWGIAASCQRNRDFRSHSVSYLSRAVRILDEQGSVGSQLVETLADLALAELGSGNLEAARDSYRRAHDLAEKQLHADSQADPLRPHLTLARVLRQSVLFSLPGLAVQKLEQGLHHAREARCLREEAAALNNLGTVLTRLGEVDRARACFLESQALFAAVNGDFCADLSWNNLGILELLARRPQAALDNFRKAREAAGEAHSAAIAVRGNEGVALFQAGQTSEGLHLLWQTLTEAQTLKDPLYVEDLRHNFARCCIESGDPAAAIRFLDGHLPLQRPMEMENLLVQARYAALLLEAYDKAGRKDQLAASQHLVEQARYLRNPKVNDRETRPYEDAWVRQLMTLC